MEDNEVGPDIDSGFDYMRQVALELAIKMGGSPQSILEAAEKFYSFLMTKRS